MSVHLVKRGNCTKAAQRKRTETNLAVSPEQALQPSEPVTERITTLDLLEELEADFIKLRGQNRRLLEQLEDARKEIAALQKELATRTKEVVRRPAATKPVARKTAAKPRPAPKPVRKPMAKQEEPVIPKRVLGRTLADLRPARRPARAALTAVAAKAGN